MHPTVPRAATRINNAAGGGYTVVSGVMPRDPVPGKATAALANILPVPGRDLGLAENALQVARINLEQRLLPRSRLPVQFRRRLV